MTVEVFKTDVRHAAHAGMMIREILGRFPNCSANFDLEDCDHILRVVSPPECVTAVAVVKLMEAFGFHAEVLSDDIPEVLKY